MLKIKIFCRIMGYNMCTLMGADPALTKIVGRSIRRLLSSAEAGGTQQVYERKIEY